MNKSNYPNYQLEVLINSYINTISFWGNIVPMGEEATFKIKSDSEKTDAEKGFDILKIMYDGRNGENLSASFYANAIHHAGDKRDVKFLKHKDHPELKETNPGVTVIIPAKYHLRVI